LPTNHNTTAIKIKTTKINRIIGEIPEHIKDRHALAWGSRGDLLCRLNLVQNLIEGWKKG
jgi:hypothetical protein